jgi:hypothetical protein
MHSNVSSLLGIVLVAKTELDSSGQIYKKHTTYNEIRIVLFDETAGASALTIWVIC